jgi:hypothetical protein
MFVRALIHTCPPRNQFNFPSAILSNCISCHLVEAFDEDVVNSRSYSRHFEYAPLFLLGGRLSFSGPCFSPLVQSSHPGLARAPIMSSHFPHGNEHEITCLARLFLASCTALELIHEPRDSQLSPSLSKNSAAQVVAAGFSQLSAS